MCLIIIYLWLISKNNDLKVEPYIFTPTLFVSIKDTVYSNSTSGIIRPRYKGGLDSLNKEVMTYFWHHLSGIQRDANYGEEDIIKVVFIVEKNGCLSNVDISEGKKLGGGIGDTLTQAFYGLKKFKPGLLAGNPIRVRLTVDIVFKRYNN
jgi:hypothetical protein